jgi:hypothetical protein
MTVRRLLATLAVIAAAAAGWWLATRPPPATDEEAIQALFRDGARAAQERRVSDAVAGLSESFRGHGPERQRLDRREVKQAVAAQVLGGRWLAVEVAGARVAVQGEAARATVELVLSRGGRGQALADLLPAEATSLRIEARLAREPEGWRIVEASWVQIPLAQALTGGEAPPGQAAPAR